MFNVEPVIDEPESGDQVEVLDSLPLGALGDLELDQFNPSNKWMELTAPVILGPLDDGGRATPVGRSTEFGQEDGSETVMP